MEAVKERMAPSVSRRMRVFLAWVLAIGAIMAFPQQSHAVDLPASDPQVKIPSGASLEQVLQAFKDATGLPCIAEKPTSERRTGQPFTGPVTGAVRFVSETLDYHVQTRAGVLLFYRQCSFPEDHPVMPRTDLAQLSEDLYRLVHPFMQPPVNRDTTGDHEALIASFSPEQLRLLGDQGLPVAALPPAQARLWSSINSSFVYAGADARLHELSDYFRHWKECEVYSYRGRAAADQRLGIRYPQAGRPSGYEFHLLPEVEVFGGPARIARHRTDVAVLPARYNRLPARFDQKLDLPAGTTSLETLFGTVRTTSGFDIRLPQSVSRYAYVTSGGTLKVRDLVDALAQMNGWHCDPDAKGHYTLIRPRYGAARTPAELHQAVSDLVPPSLTLLSTQTRGSAWAWERGQMDAVKAAYDPAALAAGVNVTELPADLQERVAQALTLDTLSPLFMGRALLNPDTPPAFMLTPERAILHLGVGTTAGAKLPSGFAPAGQVLRVTVPRPTGGTDEWGWVAGSASVKQ